MMNFPQYKELHQLLMGNNNGTTPMDIVTLLSSVPVGTFLALCLGEQLFTWFIPISEFGIIVMPIVLGVTIFSSRVYVFPYQFLLIAIAIFLWDWRSSFYNFRMIMTENIVEHKTFITNFRASTNLITVICILAVDFVVFPRKFAKTETYGFGLMDLGVGLFVICNGIVVKEFNNDSLLKDMKVSLVLIFTGIFREASIYMVDYNVPQTEYGIHWNFFFSLALCKLGAQLIVWVTRAKNPLSLAIITTMAHEYCLENGLKTWVFSNATRESFLSANREGLSSILGYISLYFAAVALGRIVNPAIHTTRAHILRKLIPVACVSWLMFTAMSQNSFGVSRRLANLGYNMWILALTTTKLIQFILFEVVLMATQGEAIYRTPELFEAINGHGFLFFLIGNFLTGGVNIVLQPLLIVDKFISVLIISVYIGTLCLGAYILYVKEICLAFW